VVLNARLPYINIHGKFSLERGYTIASHPNSLPKQKTQKQDAGEGAREPRNHKTMSYGCVGRQREIPKE